MNDVHEIIKGHISTTLLFIKSQETKLMIDSKIKISGIKEWDSLKKKVKITEKNINQIIFIFSKFLFSFIFE